LKSLRYRKIPEMLIEDLLRVQPGLLSIETLHAAYDKLVQVLDLVLDASEKFLLYQTAQYGGTYETGRPGVSFSFVGEPDKELKVRVWYNSTKAAQFYQLKITVSCAPMTIGEGEVQRVELSPLSPHIQLTYKEGVMDIKFPQLNFIPGQVEGPEGSAIGAKLPLKAEPVKRSRKRKNPVATD